MATAQKRKAAQKAHRRHAADRPAAPRPTTIRGAATIPDHEHTLRRVQGAIAAGQIAVVAFILASCVLFGMVYVAGFLDDNGYHIPGAVRIAQHLNPYYVDSPVDSHWFPALSETLVALLVIPTSSLNVTNLSGSLCFIAIVVLMYHFAGLWCRGRSGRMATVACVSTIPLLIGQTLAFYIDIHIALAVSASLFLYCRAFLHRRARDAYYGLAVALLVPGMKYSGILMFLVLGPAFLVCLWRAAPPRRPGLGLVALVLACGLLTSGWYVRNWMVRGNPLFPFQLPRWFEPIRDLSPAPYEYDPNHDIVSPAATYPHPYVPESWLRHQYTPHMTDDAFGASTVLAGVCVVLSLLVLRRYGAAARHTWLFLLAVTAAIMAIFPYGVRIPRYVLFLPLVLSLGPAVLCGAARAGREHLAVTAFCAGLLLFSAVYAVANLIVPGPVANNVGEALKHLVPYDPVRIRNYAYVRRGHLRIGYTSGFGKFIGTLYDDHLTNTLIPLHYKNYRFNTFQEMHSPEEFIRHVESLHLDYIHVFDPQYPGVDLLRKHFPEKIMPEELRPR